MPTQGCLAARYPSPAAPPREPAQPASRRDPAIRASERPDDIAIVGLAGRFPGAASPEALWRLLVAGETAIGEIPPDRWDAAEASDPARGSDSRIYCRWGGFLDDVDAFDARFFHISPVEARLMHPEERLLLQCAWSMVEDAGCGLAALRAGRTGTFVGVTGLSYPLLGIEQWVAERNTPPDSTSYSLANRLSHWFDWTGPSLVVDTACSSSLVALHLACESLRRGECEAALAAGANLYLHPAKHLRMCQNRLLATAPRGILDGDGDGFIPGEGVGAVLLMPLRRALAERHAVHGVVKASAIAHSGRTANFLAPSAAAQAGLIRDVLRRAGLDASAIGYVELQAMGTVLGDAVEWKALREVFEPESREAPCPVGSLKPNIGHLEAASGIAQLAKVLLQFRHGTLPPHRFAAEIAAEAGHSPAFHLQRDAACCIAEGGASRHALVTSLGAGGTQACVVIAEPPLLPAREESGAAQLFPLSARTAEQLRAVAADLREALAASDAALSEIAFTLQAGREPLQHRLAIVAQDHAALLSALDAASSGAVPPGSHAGVVAHRHETVALAPAVAEALYRSRDLDQVARLWVGNGVIDWQRLAGEPAPNRVHLPTYPFEKRRHWITEPAAPAGDVVSRYYDRFAVDLAVAGGHLVFAPLLQRPPGFSWLKSFIEPEQHSAHHALMVAAQERMKDVLLRRLPAAPELVLDIGCGLGTDLIALAKRHRGLTGHGYTISPRQAEIGTARIAEAGLHDRISIRCRDSAKDPFPATYDAVLAFEVTCHIADKAALFGKIARHLKPGGRLLMADVVADTVSDVTAAHLGQHTPGLSALAAILAAQGLAVTWAADASKPIGLFLDEPDFERHLAELTARHPSLRGAEDEHRGWDRFGQALRLGLFRYLLLEIGAARTPEAILAAANRQAMDEAMPYAEAIVLSIIPRSGPRFAEKNDAKSKEPKQAFVGRPTNACLGEADSQTAAQLRRIVAELLELRVDEVDDDTPFAEYGLNSLQALLLTERINRAFGLHLAFGVLYDAPCIRDLAEVIGAPHPAPPVPAPAPARNDDIAVIGLSARFPGSPDAAALWRNLRAGVDGVREIPPERWSLSGFYDPAGGLGRSVSKWAGLLEDVDAFDPLFFNIAPTEAEVMDPQQRLFLEGCWHALEDAGYAGADVSGCRCGVFVGVTGSDYVRLLDGDGAAEQMAQAMLGNDHAILAARIAYHLNLKGPAIALNTACSSSLVAVHWACEALRRGETDMMLAGGVSLTLDPQALVIMSQAGMLSRHGRCRAYGAEADGIVIGEGVGVVVLKRLDRALDEGDFVYGVIKGSAINQDGRTNGITAPSGASQTALIREVHDRFGIAPDTITCVEGHGTGTKLGDPIEIAALAEAFRAGTQASGFCALGSIKSNIGHASAASGIAGLIKMLLALQHGEIPPTLHAEQATNAIDLTETPFTVNRALRPWPSPRRAAVSAFGFSGTNCHLVVEEAPVRAAPAYPDADVLIPLSARTAEQLRDVAKALLGGLAEAGAPAPADIAYTLQSGRRALPQRLAMVVGDRAQAAALLSAFLRDEAPAGLWLGRAERDDTPACPDTMDLPDLAAHWVRGGRVEWARLNDTPRRRVPLPTYPFARQRFWAGKRPAPDAGPWQRRLTGEEPFLAGHVVQGRPVLPAVAALDLAAEAGAASAGRLVRSIGDVVWLRPVIVDTPTTLTVQLEPGDGHTEFRILGPDGSVHVEGRLGFEPLPGCEPVAIDVVRRRPNTVLDGPACYRRFAERGLRYGAAMQPIRRLHCGDGEALAELAPSSADGFTLHPAAMDGAFQTLLGLWPDAGAGPGALRLPFSLAALEILGDPHDARYAHVRATGGSATGRAATCDLQLMDAAGQVLVRMRDLLVRGPAETEAATPPPASRPAADGLERHLLTVFAEVLKLPAAEIDPAEPFETYGIDSILVTRLTRALEKGFGPLPMTLLFECQTLADLATHLTDRHADAVQRLGIVPRSVTRFAGKNDATSTGSEQARGGEATRACSTGTETPPVQAESAAPLPAPRGQDAPIAIIGMSGRFPQAETLDEFWDNLRAGRDCITEIPAERWDHARLFDPDRTKLGSTYTKWGGFVDAASFDPLFFAIPPSDAALIDPQERLFLETAWATLEDAGTTRARLGKQVGVFVGVMYGEYQFLGIEDRLSGGRIALNSSYASIANRVSYCLNLQGPSLALDTMCSSSLSALHLACDALRRGECRAAIAGGVNLSLHPNKYLQLAQGQFASSDGRCRSFGEGGDGYVPGEGVGAVLLKPLAAALADGDRVLAVIRASAIGHNGKTNGYTVPNPKAQADVIRTGLQRAGWEAGSISYVEAHGTGTALGDPIEIAALSEAFGTDAPDRQLCAIGSVKSNIGHLESAAGIAGLAKLVLQMRHRMLVPSLHSAALNPHIDFAASPFQVQQDAAPWQPAGGGQRRAGLSSFGAGGSNAHLLVEEPDEPSQPPRDDRPDLIVLSAKDPDRLRAAARNLQDHLHRHPELALAEIAHTLRRGREAMPERLAIVAASKAALLAVLTAWLGGEITEQVYHGHASGRRGGRAETLPEIARLWVDGADEAVEHLSRPGARIVSLPTYPFARERYWVSRPPAANGTARLHPLLERNASTVRGLRFTTPWDASAVFARDHRVGGRVLLPGAVLLEMARAGAALLSDGPVAGLSHHAWVQPIDLTAGPLTVDIDFTPEGDTSLGYEIATLAAEGARKVHAAGRVGLGTAEADPPVDVTAIRQRCSRRFDAAARPTIGCTASDRGAGPLSRAGYGLHKIEPHQDATLRPVIASEATQSREPGRPTTKAGLLRFARNDGCAGEGARRADQEFFGDAVYRRLRSRGLDYGPAFQTIHALHCGEREALAELHLPAALLAEAGSFVLHPVLLDGALQALHGLAPDAAGDATGTASVPFAAGGVRILRSLPPRCLAHVTLAASTGAVQKYDIRLLAESGEVLAVVTDLAVRTLPVEAPVAAPRPAESRPVVRHFHRVWTEAPAVSQEEAAGRDLILDEDETVWQAMRKTSPEAVLVQPGERFGRPDRFRYTVRPRHAEDYSRLLDALAEDGLMPARIHHLLPLRTREPADPTASFGGLLALVQTLIRRGGTSHTRLLSVFANGPEGPEPQHHALGAFLRSAAMESPALRASTLAIDPDWDSAQIAARLRSEAATLEAEIRYAGGRRLAPRFAAADPAPRWDRLPWRNRGRYLITGGLGGLGLLVAGFLARQYKARLILTGRSAPGTESAAAIMRLQAFGAQVRYVSADIAEPEQARRLAASALDAYGGIDGVIHAAGTLCDGLLRTKDPADAASLLRPKIHGAVHLDAVFAEQPLDLFVMFSSLAGAMGNLGQADYAFANGFLDQFAVRREARRRAGQRSGASVSINWPLWDGGGMGVDDETRHWLESRLGLTPLAAADGLLSMTAALSRSEPSFLVVAGHDGAIDRLTGTPATPPTAATEPIPAPDDRLRAATEALLTRHVREELQLGERVLPPQTGFDAYGLDSVRAMRLTRALETLFGELPRTLFYEYPSVAALAGYLLDHHGAKLAAMEGIATVTPTVPAAMPVVKSPTPPADSGDIAIIGLAGRFPQADDLFAFWDNLRAGRDCITPVPPDRWDNARHYHPDRGRIGKTYGKWGGFLRDMAGFDPLFFGISPREAEFMDPQERLFLQTAWHTIEDAGYTRARLPREVGVYVGVMYAEYQLHGAAAVEAGDGPAPGASYASIANRVSYFFDFSGPSIALDTMCSSSLTAIHLACDALRRGDVAMALAGGVNLSIHPQKYVALAQGQFLSSDGRCRAFGADGDGYVPGEGVGSVLLKPLAQAMHDRDTIHAVIKGSAVNHGGRATGYTVPNPNAQGEVIRRVLDRSGVPAGSIGYVEAHGTGTALGDPIEIAGLSRAFRHDGASGEPCAIGSVKSNIGHLEAAAGVAGLAKILLQFRYCELVPSLHAQTLNPAIRLEGSPFEVQRSLAPWPTRGLPAGPRRAGLSSFGAGGANAHVILEEAPPFERRPVPAATLPFLFSARTESSLAEGLSRMLVFLRRGEVQPLDAAFTLAVGREAMACRIAILAAGTDELAARLEQAIAGRHGDGIVLGTRKVPSAGLPEDVTDLVPRWLAEGKLAELAEFWAGGGDVDWRALGPLREGRIVALPGYAFDTARYWIRASDQAVVADPEPDDDALAMLRKLAAGRITLGDADQWAESL